MYACTEHQTQARHHTEWAEIHCKYYMASSRLFLTLSSMQHTNYLYDRCSNPKAHNHKKLLQYELNSLYFTAAGNFSK